MAEEARKAASNGDNGRNFPTWIGRAVLALIALISSISLGLLAFVREDITSLREVTRAEVQVARDRHDALRESLTARIRALEKSTAGLERFGLTGTDRSSIYDELARIREQIASLSNVAPKWLEDRVKALEKKIDNLSDQVARLRAVTETRSGGGAP
jgi:chromosome segregation ATPase